MIVENEFPILEYSTEKNAVIDPVCRGGTGEGAFSASVPYDIFSGGA